MAAFVLDASTALKWFLEDEGDRAYSLAILATISDECRPIVPWLWYYEIASTILTQVRRKRIVFEKAAIYLNIIDEMAMDIDPPVSSAILQLPRLARAHNLTGYDAAYLELAQRLQLPLATSDRELIRAASEGGVRVLTAPSGN